MTVPQFCTGCTACYSICPHEAISMAPDKKGFIHPIVHKEKCVECGLCDIVCEHVSHPDKTNPQKIIALKHGDQEIRATSSSGGAFTLLASEIINKGGVVYGVVFDDKWNVKHGRTTDLHYLKRMQGSKYVQSNLGRTYHEVVNDLENGRQVLFTGTPCQCGGLKEFLNQKEVDCSRLYLCDLICHGVPSPKVWKDYINYREKTDTLKVGEGGISFRDKSHGWRDFRLCLQYENGVKKNFRQNEDYFYILFFHHLIIRESCFDCKFSSLERVSDITIGDFWGLEEFYTEFNDDKGTSLLLINTPKGEELFNNVKENCKYIMVKKEAAIKRQPNLRMPTKANSKYEQFWVDYYENPFEDVLSKYADKTIWGVIKRRIIFKFLFYTGIFPYLIKVKKYLSQ